MPDLRTPSFGIALPAGYLDVSTYAFILPSHAQFKPTIVITLDRRPGPVDLVSHVIEQRALLRHNLENFEVISEFKTQHAGVPAFITVFESGSDKTGRFRQKQFFVQSAESFVVYSLTATDLAVSYAHTEPLFDQVIATFRPGN